MGMKKKHSEADIAEVLVNYLESKDWDVYQEVQFNNYGGVADIVAVKNNQMWIVETKISLGFAVLAQAEKWQAHYRSIAVLRSTRGNDKGRKLAYKVCRNYLGIGIIEVSPTFHDIWVIVAPELQEGVDYFVENQTKILTPLHKDFAKAGSPGSGHLTPFKYTMLQVKEFIQKNPKCTLNEIIGHIGKGHYSSESSAKNNLRTSLRDWVDWCTVDWDVDKRANVYEFNSEK